MRDNAKTDRELLMEREGCGLTQAPSLFHPDHSGATPDFFRFRLSFLPVCLPESIQKTRGPPMQGAILVASHTQLTHRLFKRLLGLEAADDRLTRN